MSSRRKTSLSVYTLWMTISSSCRVSAWNSCCSPPPLASVGGVVEEEGEEEEEEEEEASVLRARRWRPLCVGWCGEVG